MIADEPLSSLVPVENAAMDGRTVIQWDKDDLEELGLLKVDVLALGMLSCLRRGLDLLARHRGVRLELATIPAEDPAVYAMLQGGDSIGVFQVESRAQMAMLPRLKPACFYDLVIQVAIVRPGPIQGGMVHPYLRRRNGEEPVDYPSAELQAVFERTLGVPIFQEQVMELAMVAAGFSAGEADQLRRSMAAWKRRGGLEHWRERILGGMAAHGYAAEFAERVFEQIKGFGSYGFPESHAASFALLVYASAWLKCHQPAIFAAALLNSLPMGFYAPAQIVADARRHGVRVLPVDALASDFDCTLEEQDGSTGALALRLGFRIADGLAEAAMRRLVAARAQAPFADVGDLARRAGLDRGQLQKLAAAGALRRLAGHRHRALWAVAGSEPVPAAHARGLDAPVATAAAGATADAAAGAVEAAVEVGFGAGTGAGAGAAVAIAAMAGRTTGSTTRLGSGMATRQTPLLLADDSARERRVALRPPDRAAEVHADYAALGLSLAAHPLSLVRPRLARRGLLRALDLEALADGAPVRLVGLVTMRQRPATASGVTFVTLEDETGQVNLVVWRQVALRDHRALLESRLLAVRGHLQAAHGVRHLIAARLDSADALLPSISAGSRDFH